MRIENTHYPPKKRIKHVFRFAVDAVGVRELIRKPRPLAVIRNRRLNNFTGGRLGLAGARRAAVYPMKNYVIGWLRPGAG